MNLNFLKDFDFFAGVPDSLLSPVCSYLITTYGVDTKHHVIAANEGNAVGLAAGYHLATGKVPVVYLQNSGQGNIINPVASLLNDKVYGIPCLFLVGWRGEPGVHDEPQHVFQGEVTVKLMEDMDIACAIIDKETTEAFVNEKMKEFNELFKHGKQAAFIIKKGALKFEGTAPIYKNSNKMLREEIIRHITNVSEKDFIVSTTGKASRELFEIREKNGQSHGYDFLTVGSMGHSSSIALSLAAQKDDKKIWIIDGDGAALMHMGGMALIGTNSPKNVIHIVINNSAHESVGGAPTVAGKMDLVTVALGCGYKNAVCVDDFESLDKALKEAKLKNELCFIEVKCAIGAREDLGRPTTTAKENKEAFMKYLSE